MLVKSERIPRRRCGRMDVGKDGSPLKFLQTPEPHPRRAHAPGNDRPSEVVAVGGHIIFLFYWLGTGRIESSSGVRPGEDGLWPEELHFGAKNPGAVNKLLVRKSLQWKIAKIPRTLLFCGKASRQDIWKDVVMELHQGLICLMLTLLASNLS